MRPLSDSPCSKSHVTRHTSHITRHTSHVTRHTSHVTHHTSHAPSSSLHQARSRSTCGICEGCYNVAFAVHVKVVTILHRGRGTRCCNHHVYIIHNTQGLPCIHIIIIIITLRCCSYTQQHSRGGCTHRLMATARWYGCDKSRLQ